MVLERFRVKIVSEDVGGDVVGKGEMINVMGDLMPLVKLYEFFGIKCDHENPWEAMVAVVEGKDRSKCIMVDEIVGEEEVVIKSLGESLKDIRGDLQRCYPGRW